VARGYGSRNLCVGVRRLCRQSGCVAFQQVGVRPRIPGMICRAGDRMLLRVDAIGRGQRFP
jgi:hypothetical protein